MPAEERQHVVLEAIGDPTGVRSRILLEAAEIPYFVSASRSFAVSARRKS
jgi:hypothetical protein